jgi:hypothetical protein
MEMLKMVLLLSVLLLLPAANARLPQVGDHVGVAVNTGTAITTYQGEITDIKDGLLCLKLEAFGTSKGTSPGEDRDICVGIGSINLLSWYD